MYERKIEIAGQSVTVRELTLKDYRNWLKSVMDQANGQDLPLYSVDRDLFEEMEITDFHWFTDLTPENIDAMRPSDLREVIAAIKEINPDFFAMRGRMRNTANQVISLMGEHLNSLTAPPAHSSSMDTSTFGPTP